MNKLCPGCKTLKSKKCFSKHSKRKDGLQVYCKECLKVRNALRYQNGYKEKQNECNRLNRGKIRKLVNETKTANPCPCGESDVACLDFHHLVGKDKTIGHMMANTYGLDKVIKEINKCCVLCSNCHRKLHAGSQLSFDPKDLKCIQTECERGSG